MKKRDTSEKRNSILKAAAKAFEKYGYENAGMDKIADEANASKRTVYNHFSSKEELFYAVIEKYDSDTTKRRAITYNPDLPIKEQLSFYIDREIAVIKDPDWIGLKKAIIPVFMRDTELSLKMMDQYGSEQKQLENLIAAAAEDGKLTAENPQIAAAILSASISGLFFWPSLFLGPMPDLEAGVLKEEIITTFLERFGI